MFENISFLVTLLLLYWYHTALITAWCILSHITCAYR